MSNRFAILADYPKEGPAVPEREKVQRQKDHHESGTGRRDRTKREGRGPSNWGNPRDDTRVNRKADRIDAEVEKDQDATEVDSTPKVQYVDAAQFFDDSDDEDVAGAPVTAQKAQKAIDQQYLDIMTEKAKKQVVAKEEDEDEDEDNQLDTNFLSTDQALRQQRQNQSRGRGAPRGRGGRGRGPRREGGDRPPRRDDGERPPRREGAPGRKFAERPARTGEQKQEGQQQKGDRQPRRDQQRKPRDQRTSGVQHQRVNGGRQFTAADFPSL